MRAILLTASFLLLLAPLPLASASEEYNCHSWEITAGDRSEGAGVSTEDGAFYVATQRVPSGLYVVSDGDPVRSDVGLFSIWLYEESNGEQGLQRGDEACDETDGWQKEPDCSILCGF